MSTIHSRPFYERAAGRLAGRNRPLNAPPLLRLGGFLIGGAIALPMAYLLFRAAGVGPQAWRLLVQPSTLAIAGRSVALAISVTLLSFVVAIPLAWLTVRTDLPGRRMWSVLTVLPLVIPSYVGAFTLAAALGPYGLVQQVLGVERLPDIYGYPGALLTLTLFAYPYALLSVRAGLRGLDPAQEEAARSLGDSGWQAFLRVTLSHLRPSIASGGLLVALYALSDFGAVSILRYTTFTHAIYVQYRASFDRSLAALLALVLVGLAVIILSVEARAQGRALQYRRGSTARIPHPARLGLWRWPALAFCSLIVLLALGVPLAVIGYWLWRGLQSGEAITFVWDAAWHSVYASGMAAVVATLVALPVALLVVRYPDKVTRLIARSSYAGYALPGIVVALSLVFFGANYARPLYQTVYLLVFAYVVRFLPQAITAERTSLLQVSPRIEEAARGLGRSPNGVLVSVTLPMIRPGLLASLALVFLTSMKELPATLLLGPTGYDTLATRVWSATAEGFYARAAWPTLLLVLVSALSVGLILAQDRSEDRERH